MVGADLVGAGLLAKLLAAVMAPSRASPLPQ